MSYRSLGCRYHHIEHGSVYFQYLPMKQNGTSINGHSATYRCNSFYHFPNEEKVIHRECRRFGPRQYNWAGDQPICIRKLLFFLFR